MTRAYTVKIEVEVYGDSLENAKENAVKYLKQVSEVRDDEITRADMPQEA